MKLITGAIAVLLCDLLYRAMMKVPFERMMQGTVGFSATKRKRRLDEEPEGEDKRFREIDFG